MFVLLERFEKAGGKHVRGAWGCRDVVFSGMSRELYRRTEIMLYIMLYNNIDLLPV